MMPRRVEALVAGRMADLERASTDTNLNNIAPMPVPADSASSRFPSTAPLLGKFSSAIRLVRLRPFDTSTEAGRAAERHRRIALSFLIGVVSRIVHTFVL